MANTINQKHLERQKEFSLKNFGPGLRSQGIIKHIKKELIEIDAAPTDVEEWVDVVILGLDGAWRAATEIGLPLQAIIDILVAKQAKNENRAWPDWQQFDSSEPIEHIRDPK